MPRVPASLFVVAAALALAVLVAGCGRKPEAPESAFSPEEAAQRLEKAEGLFAVAARENPRGKLEYYRRLIAYYPESPRAAAAYFLLVFYLLDPANDLPDEAFTVATEFAERFPDDLNVSEVFKLQDQRAGVLENRDARRKIQDAWIAWAEAARKRAGGWPVVERTKLWIDSGDALRRRHRPADAVAVLAEAAAFDVPQKDLTLSALLLMARIQAQDLSDAKAAIATYERALVLARAGIRGETPERIQEWIAELRKS